METLWQDLRYAARSFARKPGYTLVIILTLALGIGAVSAVFSFFNAVILRPLPYEQSERLAQIQSVEPEKAGAYFSHPDFIDLRDQSQSFERLAAVRSGGWMLTGNGDAERQVVWAVPKGHEEREEDRAMKSRAALILAEYQKRRARYIGSSKRGVVKMLRDWLNDDGACRSPA
jgi:hypothetical protein